MGFGGMIRRYIRSSNDPPHPTFQHKQLALHVLTLLNPKHTPMSAFQSRRYESVERNLKLEVFSFIDALQSNTDFRNEFISHKIALASFHKSLWAQFCQLYALPIQIDGEATGNEDIQH